MSSNVAAAPDEDGDGIPTVAAAAAPAAAAASLPRPSSDDSALHARINAILFTRWDPLRVGKCGAPADEYSSYVAPLLQRLLRGDTDATIGAALLHFERNEMGLQRTSSPAHIRRIVQELRALVPSRSMLANAAVAVAAVAPTTPATISQAARAQEATFAAADGAGVASSPSSTTAASASASVTVAGICPPQPSPLEMSYRLHLLDLTTSSEDTAIELKTDAPNYIVLRSPDVDPSRTIAEVKQLADAQLAHHRQSTPEETSPVEQLRLIFLANRSVPFSSSCRPLTELDSRLTLEASGVATESWLLLKRTYRP